MNTAKTQHIGIANSCISTILDIKKRKRFLIGFTNDCDQLKNIQGYKHIYVIYKHNFEDYPYEDYVCSQYAGILQRFEIKQCINYKLNNEPKNGFCTYHDFYKDKINIDLSKTSFVYIAIK